MSLDRTDIEKIARLARLSITEDDIPKYVRDLSNILALVAQLGEVDTTGVEPMAHPLEITARLRPDRVTETNQRDLYQKIAPTTARGYYLVPKVIE